MRVVADRDGEQLARPMSSRFIKMFSEYVQLYDTIYFSAAALK
jgi:hypothetical protein